MSEREVIEIDINSLTVREIADIEDAIGATIGEISLVRMPARAHAAFVWIMRRRADPRATLEAELAAPYTARPQIRWVTPGDEETDPNADTPAEPASAGDASAGATG